MRERGSGARSSGIATDEVAEVAKVTLDRLGVTNYDKALAETTGPLASNPRDAWLIARLLVEVPWTTRA